MAGDTAGDDQGTRFDSRHCSVARLVIPPRIPIFPLSPLSSDLGVESCILMRWEGRLCRAAETRTLPRDLQ
jgi:hypothetical protein